MSLPPGLKIMISPETVYSVQDRSSLSIAGHPRGFRRIIRGYLCPILLGGLFCVAAECAQEAQDYLVIGSYEKERQAISEGEHFSRAAGVEVLLVPGDVNGQSYYRLLVHLFTDEYDQIRLESQLRYAGAGDMWRTSITGKEPGLRSLFAVVEYAAGEIPNSTVALNDPAKTVKRNFLVAGSFRDAEKAQTRRLQLASSFVQLVVKTVNVDGVDYHRVLIGPVEASAEEEYQIRTRAAGVPDAWLLRDILVEVAGSKVPATAGSDIPDNGVAVTPQDKAANEEISVTTRKISINGVHPAKTSAETGSYNPAKLRDTPGPFFGENGKRE